MTPRGFNSLSGGPAFYAKDVFTLFDWTAGNLLPNTENENVRQSGVCEELISDW
jgi:hypothetical protein